MHRKRRSKVLNMVTGRDPMRDDKDKPYTDWMRAVRTPTSYRVAGSSVTINTGLLAKCGIGLLLILSVISLLIPAADYEPKINIRYSHHPKYNSTYPLSKPVVDSKGTTFRIGIIADLDTDSKVEGKKPKWISYFKRGYLTISKDHKKINVDWDDKIINIESGLSLSGRGMELSELVVFNGKLYTCDDRTGVIFEITDDVRVIPWVVLQDGNGNVVKGFKCEWMTVKGEALWAGGLGKEWTTTTGIVQNFDPQWVKSVGHTGDILHHNWIENYNALRHKGGFDRPGYMIHESGVWSDIHNKWFFLPRRASKETYTEEADERRATNILFQADESFKNIKMWRVGEFNPTHGFSSFKFIPGTNDEIIVALKSEEDNGKIASYIMCFTLDGDILLPETKIGDRKFEGVEFI